MEEAQQQWCGVRALERAASACARRKRSRPDAVAFRLRFGEEILSLAARLQSGRYRPEPGWSFVTDQPKPREIHAAAFRDRVVHHLLHGLLEPRFERRFIEDSFACRRGKGTHAAALRLQRHLWDASRHGEVRAHMLQMDVRNFFCSIHKPTLLGLLAKGFTALERSAPAPSPWALTRTLVENEAGRTAVRRGPAAGFARVPPHKRLGANPPDRGLPIGNLTSQFFANVYLDALDQFVKRTLGARHYVRYVDDFVLAHPDPEVLREWERRIREFLRRRLLLEAHPAEALGTAAGGVDFAGYVIRPGYLLPRRRVVRAMERKIRQVELRLAHRPVAPGERALLPLVGQVTGPCSVQRLDPRLVEALRAVWTSYQGHLSHASAWGLLRRLWAAHPVSRSVLGFESGRVVGRLLPPRPVGSLREQVFRLGKGLAPTALVVKVGRFAECWSTTAARRLGFRPTRRGRRKCWALPWLAVNRALGRAKWLGLAVAVALELPEAQGSVKARRVAFVIRPDRFSGFRRRRLLP